MYEDLSVFQYSNGRFGSSYNRFHLLFLYKYLQNVEFTPAIRGNFHSDIPNDVTKAKQTRGSLFEHGSLLGQKGKFRR